MKSGPIDLAKLPPLKNGETLSMIRSVTINENGDVTNDVLKSVSVLPPEGPTHAFPGDTVAFAEETAVKHAHYDRDDACWVLTCSGGKLVRLYHATLPLLPDPDSPLTTGRTAG